MRLFQVFVMYTIMKEEACDFLSGDNILLETYYVHMALKY
jgi:hypothetical protein